MCPSFESWAPLEVLADDCGPLVLGGLNQKAVLALLLLRPNQVEERRFCAV